MEIGPVLAPFSLENRRRLIDEFLGPRAINPADAWRDVYRLLLWVDSRTGLAHCYESDKSQPGKPWYPRSLVFHKWLAAHLGTPPTALKDEIDFMFREVIGAVTAAEADQMVRKATETQFKLFPRDEMPQPGDDPALRAILEPLFSGSDDYDPDDDLIDDVIRKIYAYIGSGNKRANLLGRGFEDVLAAVIARLPSPPALYGTQTALATIPGFRPARVGDKVEKVDLWVGDDDTRRILVSAKWSVRADREKQMGVDFATYVNANILRDPFEYVWVTNEFDPARLVANATDSAMNRMLLDSVVHICPEALWTVHNLDSPTGRNRVALRELIESGRIIGLGEWLEQLGSLTPSYGS